MTENKTVHAPYNFVPFSSKLLLPYMSPEQLPPHDAILPELKTGEIHITLRAETPVFVSDGDKTSDDKQNLHFFCLPNGEYAIPGSSVRGMTRENMQILGFGLIRPGEDLEDYRVHFREIASAREAVGSNVKQYYREVLNIQARRSPETGKTFSRPENVHSGYLYCEGNRYLIRPTTEPSYRVSRRHPDVAELDELYAKIVPVSFTAGGGRVKTISIGGRAADGARKGVLLCTGKAAGKPNSLYLFPEPDHDAPVIALSEQDITDFKVDFETRRNALKGLQKLQDRLNRDEKEWLSFWELPGEGESKPVFYIRHNGRLYFGMSAFPRIGYPYSLVEGLPKRHQELKTGANVALDFPHAILGFADKENAYRSRVSFGDFPAEHGTKESARVSRILGNPKPSYYPGYLCDGKDYTEDAFQLRGYKQYWLHEPQLDSVDESKERICSTMRPLPEGTLFHGVIRFKNLKAEELGLLLWSLRLEEGCFQSIGMGKPYGYGRMRLDIDRLSLLNTNTLYGVDLSASPWMDATESIHDYIRQYDAYAAEKLYIKKPNKQPSILSQEEIRDFFFMKSSIRSDSETAYMDLKEYQNIRNALPTVEQFRTRADATDNRAANTAILNTGDDFKAQLLKLQRRL